MKQKYHKYLQPKLKFIWLVYLPLGSCFVSSPFSFLVSSPARDDANSFLVSSPEGDDSNYFPYSRPFLFPYRLPFLFSYRLLKGTMRIICKGRYEHTQFLRLIHTSHTNKFGTQLNHAIVA